MHAAENKTGEYYAAYQEAKSNFEHLRKKYQSLEIKHDAQLQLNEAHTKN